MKTKTTQFERVGFYLVLLSVIFPVLQLDYIVTGDAPCHFYNSRILLDWHFRAENAFYEPFLTLNKHWDPNWMTNLVQIPLLSYFSVVWAEKLFFLLYLFTFSFGFRKLVLQINPDSAFVSSLGAVFAWNHILMMGFTNNAWSLALWFWVVSVWLQLQSGSWKNYPLITLTFFLTYLAHPIGLTLSFITIGTLVAFEGLFLPNKSIKTVSVFYLKQGAKLIIVALPVLALFLDFYMRRQWSVNANPINPHNSFLNFFKLRGLLCFSSKEQAILFGYSVLLTILFAFAIFLKSKTKITKNDGWFAVFIILLLIVLYPPAGISGGLDMDKRLSMLPYLGLLGWIATNSFPNWIRVATAPVVLIFIGALLAVRLPVQKNAAAYAAEVVACKDHIQDKSTLLALNYDWNGRNPDGSQIANRIWLFNHIDCYLGVYKQLIISNNYEANFWYFPLIERWETNMYKQTDKDGINFDNRPPRADILSYPRRTGGQKIDYVLMLSYTDEWAAHPYTREIFTQLDSMYQPVYTSTFGRARLYTLKNRMGAAPQ